MRWTHRRGSKVEEVSARSSHAIKARRRPARRPPDTIDASVPESISRYSQIDKPAAHEAIELVFALQVQFWFIPIIMAIFRLINVRSGGIYFDDSTVGGPHSGGMADTNRTWSSRSGADTDAYVLYFDATIVNPSNGPNNHYIGFSLRCLSTVLGMWRIPKLSLGVFTLTYFILVAQINK